MTSLEDTEMLCGNRWVLRWRLKVCRVWLISDVSGQGVPSLWCCDRECSSSKFILYSWHSQRVEFGVLYVVDKAVLRNSLLASWLNWRLNVFIPHSWIWYCCRGTCTVTQLISQTLILIQTVYCWQPCLSSCRSSSLEQSTRGRRLSIITADFPLSFKNSIFFDCFILTWFFTGRLHRYYGPISNVSLFRPL